MIIYNVKKYRKSAGLTQQQLAEAAGVRRETIIRMEKGLFTPGIELAYKICEVLKSDIKDTFQYNSNQIDKEKPKQEQTQEQQQQEPTQKQQQQETTRKNTKGISEELIKKIYDMSYNEFEDYYMETEVLLKYKIINADEYEFISLVDSHIDQLTEDIEYKEWRNTPEEKRKQYKKIAIEKALNEKKPL